MGEKAALAVDAKVRDPRRSGCIGSAARFRVVLKVDEDLFFAVLLPLPGDVLESLERAVLLASAVGEIAYGTYLDILDRFAGSDGLDADRFAVCRRTK